MFKFLSDTHASLTGAGNLSPKGISNFYQLQATDIVNILLYSIINLFVSFFFLFSLWSLAMLCLTIPYNLHVY